VKYQVTVLPKAEAQLYNAALWWSENRDPEQAFRWIVGFEKTIQSLGIDPSRHGLAREDDAFSFELRQLNFGLGNRKTRRAIFEIRDHQVLVYAIRHLAQDAITTDDI